MKYYLIAGEASGDLHGSNLMKEIRIHDPEAEFRFFGGDLMKEVGGNLVRHYRDMAFMGLFDVVFNLRTINRNLKKCKSDLLAFHPDVLILIDYPGFNFRIAEFAHASHIRVFYYISPKIWAWKEWRIKKIKAWVDEMFTIFPFETEFFSRHNYRVHFVGNPLLDSIEEKRKSFRSREEFMKANHLNDKPIVALLPGSRKQEIRILLPVMSKLVKKFPGYQFVITGASSLDPALYQKYSVNRSIPVLYGQTYELLSHSHAAVVTSGTATLETALLNVPQVVLYKMPSLGAVGYKIFRFFFLKIRLYSLPNLVLGEEAVREFIMDKMKYKLVKPEVKRLLSDEGYRAGIFTAYSRLRQILGGPGASGRAAAMMIGMINDQNSDQKK